MAKKRAARQTAAVKQEIETAPNGPAPDPDPPQEPERWRMPTVSRGQPVVFYPRGTMSKRNADLGFVSAVGESAVSISYRNQGLNECYHRDDPRLVDNPEIRNEIGGVWEFTTDQIKITEKLTDLERRIQKLEG